mmetsp:Transcript_12226/g.22110  ORF Transcript_12226/g.22110 Transcript_12226/m.22110 type:complete len:371 (+) Transcript_12226:309-1421(+)
MHYVFLPHISSRHYSPHLNVEIARSSPGCGFPHGGKIGVGHGLLRRQPLLVIVPQQLRNKVDRLLRHQMLVFVRNKLLPGFFRMPPQNPIEMGVQFQVIGIQVMEQFLRPKNLGNFDQLIVVIMSVKEGLLPENHPREHTSQTPHIQRVIILLQIHQQLRPLEVPTRNTDVILPPRMVKLGQTPINQPQLPLLVIDHHIVRLDIPMHHPIGMTIIQSLEKLKYVITNIIIRQRRIQYLKVGIIHMFENQTGGLALWIPHHIQQLDDVRPTAHVLQNLDLALDLFLLDGFEDFDDAFGIVPDVDSLEYFGVLSAADFADYLVVFLVAPVYGEGFVVPVVAGAMDVDVGVDSSSAHRNILLFHLTKAPRTES